MGRENGMGRGEARSVAGGFGLRRMRMLGKYRSCRVASDFWPFGFGKSFICCLIYPGVKIFRLSVVIFE